MFRTADELLNTPDPAWPLLQQLISGAGDAARLLPADPTAARREIEALQVTAKSFLGASAYHLGGLLIDSGWLRVLGCGHAECAWSITAATREVGLDQGNSPPHGLVVAVDVLGGLFAINGGFLTDVPLGHIAYFGPDTLLWADLGSGHTAWLHAMLDTPYRTDFYADIRWNGWENQVASLPANHGLSIYPPLYTRESRPIEATRRAAVRVPEIVDIALLTARQLNQN